MKTVTKHGLGPACREQSRSTCGTERRCLTDAPENPINDRNSRLTQYRISDFFRPLFEPQTEGGAVPHSGSERGHSGVCLASKCCRMTSSRSFTLPQNLAISLKLYNPIQSADIYCFKLPSTCAMTISRTLDHEFSTSVTRVSFSASSTNSAGRTVLKSKPASFSKAMVTADANLAG